MEGNVFSNVKRIYDPQREKARDIGMFDGNIITRLP
jgi:hypothetical protein